VKDFKKQWVLPGICLAAFVFSTATRAADDNALDCVMEPSDEVELSSPVQGILDSVNADRGDFVKKGQVVAKLQSGIEEASLRLAKARAVMDVDINARKAEYEMKKRTSGQFESLYEKKLASLHDYDDAKTQSVVAEHEYKKAIEVKHLAQLEQEHAQEVLNQRYLKSPINGVVIERLKSPGEFVEEQPVMKIAQIDPLNVEVIAPLTMLGKIRVGMTAEVKAEQPISETYLAKVTIVDPVVHASSGTFGVRLELPNPERKIQAGVRCKVVFNVEKVAGGSSLLPAPSTNP
jgi:RND family efflux transporter MFP subunit